MAPGCIGLVPPSRLGGVREPFCRGGRYRPVSRVRTRVNCPLRGAIFFVADNNRGALTIEHSTVHHNPSGQFSTGGYPGIFYHSSGKPIVINSTIEP